MRLGRRLSRGAKYPALKAENERLNARLAELERERDQANESWHYANGVAELAMKHRDEAEAQCERLREVLTYEVNRLAASLRRLSYAAQTTGGTAGPDRDLQGAIKQAEWALGCSDTTLTALAADQQGERGDETAHNPSYDAGWNSALDKAEATMVREAETCTDPHSLIAVVRDLKRETTP